MAGNTAGVKLLLDNGADVNIQESKSGQTALHLAVQKKNEEVVAMLMKTVRVYILYVLGFYFKSTIIFYMVFSKPDIDVDVASYSGAVAYKLATSLAQMPASITSALGKASIFANTCGETSSSDSEVTSSDSDDSIDSRESGFASSWD